MKPMICAVTLEGLLSKREAGVLFYAAEAEAVEKYERRPYMKNANMSLVGSALMRVAAAKALGVKAAEVSVFRDEAGKPFINRGGIFVSLSHSHDLCVCAVCDRPVGIDTEYIKEAFPERVANKYFNSLERSILEGGGKMTREERFYVLWTRKESVLKCSGKGMSAISEASEDGYVIKSGILFGKYAVSVCVAEMPLS